MTSFCLFFFYLAKKLLTNLCQQFPFRRTKLSPIFVRKICCEAGVPKLLPFFFEKCWGLEGARLSPVCSPEVLLFLGHDKTIADLFRKLCCEAGVPKLLPFFFEKCYGCVWGQYPRRFSPRRFAVVFEGQNHRRFFSEALR